MSNTDRKLIVTGSHIGQWVSDKIGSEWFEQGTLCIGEEKNCILSGAIFEKYNGASVLVTLATDQSLSKTFINKIHEIPFDILEVNCVICQVSSNNLKSIRLLKHLGFKQTGSIQDAMSDGDMLIFSLSKSDRRYGVNHG